MNIYRNISLFVLNCHVKITIIYYSNMETTEPNGVNLILNIIGVNSLRLGDLQITVISNSVLSIQSMTNEATSP